MKYTQNNTSKTKPLPASPSRLRSYNNLPLIRGIKGVCPIKGTKGVGAFTLVELLVTITIIAILAFISFFAFKNYAMGARDSKRITNVSIIAGGFDLNIAAGKTIVTAETSATPNLVLSGSNLTMTGYYGDINTRLLVSLKVSGNDLTTNDGFQTYKYSYYPTNNKYQVLALLEDNSNLSYTPNVNIIDRAYADTQTGGYVYIKGNFTATGGILGLLPKPLSWATNSSTPKTLDGSGEVLKTGDLTDLDPLASLPKGNVTGYAWSEGFGYLDFGYVSTNNTSFSGTVWGEGAGWIDFSPTAPNTLTLSWVSGVRKYSGKIWSEGIGWIDFNPDATNQVYIGSDGYWRGRAWSEAGGWIDFNSGTVH